MTSSPRYAAVALCAALAFTACTKSTQSTSATTDATQTAAPDTPAGASTAPDATASGVATATSAPEATAATTAPAATTGSTTTNGAAGGPGDAFITLPVYPGATEAKDGEISSTTNTGSVDIKAFLTKDDSKKVADWYKANLPSAFQSMVITAEGKTVGTFADEHKNGDGDQAVLITYDNNTSQTRIQLSTKHGK